jgi:alpha-amylase/alpha-mannosidase (GH57 family)
MKYVCVHCHFYQPPRENPSLESVELQDSAYPYHDWNERITAECYAPNAQSRVMDGENKIVQIVNNYTQISFNFGPTLLSWMEVHAPKVYQSVITGDQASQQRFSGHGSAIAQAYNHMIMPLANSKDKWTQAVWGLRDFQSRFGRQPEGMWLPETAVDLETLDILSQLGIKFTILAPRQASRVRKIGSRSWRDVSGEQIDPKMPHLIKLPSGRKINVFFYNGPVSKGVAFEGLLNNGERFAQKLLEAFAPDADGELPQLVHIATDGETYGHHHRYGEMALTYALRYLESNRLAQLTNYAEFLEMHPPTCQAEIFENSSWSCVHGVERWRDNCGCNGGRAGWNQEWRKPLREALDWLRDDLMPKYEEKGGELLKDVWAARDGYIDVILNRSEESLAKFFAQHACHELDSNEKVTALKLLEMQRHAMLMYTSCGWFFDDLSGIETVQVIHYAGRVISLAQQLFPGYNETPFLDRLAKAKSNLSEHGDGAQIYEKFVKPAEVDFLKLAAHYAISSLFESFPDHARIYCYTVDREQYSSHQAGKLKLAVGRAQFTSGITCDSELLSFGVLHFGDHNVTGGVRPSPEIETFQTMSAELAEAFSRADIPAVLQLLEREFGKNIYSLKMLFRDQQRKIVQLILDAVLEEAEAAHSQIYENHAPLMRFLSGLGIPLPGAFRTAAAVALNSQLRKAFAAAEFDSKRILNLAEEAKSVGVELDATTLEYRVRKRVEEFAHDLAANPESPILLDRLEAALSVVLFLPFPVNLWEVQNACFDLLQSVLVNGQSSWEGGDQASRERLVHLNSIAEKLQIRISAPGAAL